MSEGKYPFEGTASVGDSFSKAESGKTIEEEKPVQKAEEETYKKPELNYDTPSLGDSPSISINTVSKYEAIKSVEQEKPSENFQKNVVSESTPQNFTDNPIKTDVRSKEDFDKVHNIGADMEIES